MTKIAVIFRDSKEAVDVRLQNHRDHVATRKQLKAWNREVVSFN